MVRFDFLAATFFDSVGPGFRDDDPHALFIHTGFTRFFLGARFFFFFFVFFFEPSFY